MNVAMIGSRFSSGVTDSAVVTIVVISELLVEFQVKASSFRLTFPDMTTGKAHGECLPIK